MTVKRVICAMSGGVDSSVAAYLLKKDGYEVIGVTMKLWDCFKTPVRQTCCSTADTEDARRVCEQIGISHHVVDMREAFRKNVVEYFVREYASGRTPNPCCKCNEALKFRLLREECAKLFDTDLIATGHYARINPPSPPFPKGGQRGDYVLLKGCDLSKDQSYFLFTLTGADLCKTLFPLGELTKDDVRKIASDADLKTAVKKESQEICFVPDNDYAGFIADYYPDSICAVGNFVDKNGKKIGRHDGFHAYTIGQRRGLGFGIGRRQYIIGFNKERNEVILGDDRDLFKKEAVVRDVNWIRRAGVQACRRAGAQMPARVKIRYRHEGASAKIIPLDDNSVKVIFKEPQRAITPGQAAVFYDGDEVVGGGWIEESA